MSSIVNMSGCAPYQLIGSRRIVGAAGAYLHDEQGRDYVDLVNTFGSVLLGHADPEVTDAVTATLTRYCPTGARLDLHEQVAERVIADSTPGGRIAFYKTGTEATSAAVAAARAATGRRLVLSAGYHGHTPLWKFEPFGRRSAEDVLHFYHVPELLDELIAEHRDEVAAVIISPDFPHLDPMTVPRMLDAARRAGLLTISDEVKYGYRVCAGPSVAAYGGRADLYTYAKGLSNGWPLSCVVGDAELVGHLTDSTSTLTFEPASAAAAAATLVALERRDARRTIVEGGERFVRRAREAVAARDLPIEVTGPGFAFQLVCPVPLHRRLVEAALEVGLFVEPDDQQLPSSAFTGPVVDDAADRFAAALDILTDVVPQAVGTRLSDRDRLIAGFLQMDGIPAVDLAPTEVRAFVDERLTADEHLF